SDFIQWDVPKVLNVTFRGWGKPHPSELIAAGREEREPKCPAILEQAGLPYRVSCPKQLRDALEALAVGARVRIAYHGFKNGRTTGVKQFTVEVRSSTRR